MALNPLKASLQGVTAPLSPLMLAVQGLLDELAVYTLPQTKDRGNPPKRRKNNRMLALRRDDDELLLMLQSAFTVMV